MKRVLIFASMIVLAAILPATAQITNLVINGQTSNFTMTTGDTIRWSMNVNPVGATVTGELWYDVNKNGVIDTSVDKQRFEFTETDGDTVGNYGPSDMDGSANGHILFYQPVGLAPGKYVFKLSLGADVHILTGTFNPLASPAHTISGTVTPPAGKSPQYIFVQIQPSHGSNDNKASWEVVTDSAGNYTIGMNADTSGNPWDVRLGDNYNPFPPAIVSPQQYQLTISAPSYNGNNFTFTPASAQVAGHVYDENGQPYINKGGVYINRNDGGVGRDANVDNHGFYQIGFLLSELTAQTWTIESECNCNNGINVGEMTTAVNLPIISPGDSLYRNLTIYSINSTITGQVLMNGSPAGYPIPVSAQVNDTAWSDGLADGTTGNFTIGVSTKLYNYQVSAYNLGGGFRSTPASAHPGQSGVVINITPNGVRSRGAGVPQSFALSQNYPNPFNPTTTVDYDLPAASHVTLAVFNVLGQEVMRVVDADQHAGKYTASIDASKIPTGVYFYRLNAGNFTSVKKMLLMK